MKCPSCSAEMDSDRTAAVFLCLNCGLAGLPRTIEALTRKLALDDAARPYAPWLEDRIAALEKLLANVHGAVPTPVLRGLVDMICRDADRLEATEPGSAERLRMMAQHIIKLADAADRARAGADP